MRELLRKEIILPFLYLCVRSDFCARLFLGLNSRWVFIRIHSRSDYPIDLLQTERVGAWSKAADDSCYDQHTESDETECAD